MKNFRYMYKCIPMNNSVNVNYHVPDIKTFFHVLIQSKTKNRIEPSNAREGKDKM